MPYIKQTHITEAKKLSKQLAGRLITLSKFAVVGVITEEDFNSTCAYLKQIGANFNTNNKRLIWLEILPQTLKDLFTKQKQ
jgi:hypothetical protein